MLKATARKPHRKAILAGAGVLLLLVPLVVVNTRSEQLMGLNQPIQFDDFAFSIAAVRKTDVLGEGKRAVVAHGAFAVVSFKIDNKAKRVSYQFRPQTLVMVDDQGREHHLSAEGQRALESQAGQPAPCTGPIPAGAQCVMDLVFDVPADGRKLRLKFAYQSALLRFLDTLIYGNRVFHVPW